MLWDYDPKQDDEIYQAYRLVRSAGVTVFDTADSYGTLDLNGRAEVLLGNFERQFLDEDRSVQSKGKGNKPTPWWTFVVGAPSANDAAATQQQQQVATKFAPYPWRITSGSFVRAARESLQRLQQDKLTIAQLHWSTANYQPLQEKALWEGLGDIYDAGLCEVCGTCSLFFALSVFAAFFSCLTHSKTTTLQQAVGVSNYGPKQLQKIAARMRQRDVPLATAQVQYSLMTYKECQTMNQVCDDLGIRLISYSPLCLGLLSGKYNLDNLPRPGNPRRQLFRELLPGAQGLLQTMNVIALDYGKTQSQVAINWALCKDTVPIPGFRTIDQATGILGSVGWRLESDAVTELDRAALSIQKPMIQNVFQTK